MVETRFYARTWMLWAGFLFTGLFTLFGWILGPLFYFDIAKSNNGRPGIEAGIPLTITGFAVFPAFVAFAFNLGARQSPILLIRKQGLDLRVIGASVSSPLPLLPFELYWQMFSRRMFRHETVRLPWDDFDSITYNRGILEISGFIVDDEQSEWNERNPFSFGADAFGASTKAVEASIRYYWNNPSDRESLPGWEHTGEIFEIV